jgi:hypothetical protein
VETRALVAQYASVFNESLAVDAHTVTSPLGAWLVLALVAPAAQGEHRAELERLLGTDAEDASDRASALLQQPHPAVAAALAAWYRRELLLPAFDEWLAMLPEVTEHGPMPTQADADAWAKRTTMEIIERFPITLTPDTAIVLANALATKVSWADPFEAVDARALGGAWSTRVARVLQAPAAHTKFIAPTESADLVGVHIGSSRDGLAVASVLAAEDTEPADVHRAAHEVATGLPAVSLFDLPLGDGPAWTLREERVQRDVGASNEEVHAWLPAWSADGDHDLQAQSSLGFPAAIATLYEFLQAPDSAEAKQVAKAKYTREGFEAAAITAIAVRMSMPATADLLVRTAEIRFNRPYAVVAWAVGDGPWGGVPVFSAWVTQAEEAD